MEGDSDQGLTRFTKNQIPEGKHPLFYDPSRVRKHCSDDVAQNEEENLKFPNSLWHCIVWLLTFYFIPPVLRLMKKRELKVQIAFREKVALCIVNFLAMLFIGFIIFGLNDVCCKNIGVKLAYPKLEKSNYFSVNGKLYDIETGVHALSAAGFRVTKNGTIGKDITSAFDTPESCDEFAEDYDEVFQARRIAHKCSFAGYTVECQPKNLLQNLKPAGDVFINMKNIYPNVPLVIYNGLVLDLRLWEENANFVGLELFEVAKRNVGKDITRTIQSKKRFRERAKCLVSVLKIASIDQKTAGCVFSQGIVIISFILIISTVGIRFIIAVYFHFIHSLAFMRPKRISQAPQKSIPQQFSNEIDMDYKSCCIRARTITAADIGEPTTRPYIPNPTKDQHHSMLVAILIPCYSEGGSGIRATLDALSDSEYPTSQMCIFIVSDGIVQGSNNDRPTPDYIKDLMVLDDRFFPESMDVNIVEPVQSASWPEPYSYVAIASGIYKNNSARVYAGWYQHRSNKDLRVPMILIAKIGNELERTANDASGQQNKSKMPGNRGKRDSQVLLLSFLSKVLFDDRMTALELDIFKKLWILTGHHPGNFEALLMVDADTLVYPKALPNLVYALESDQRIMGVCGETKIMRPWQNLTTMIQVYEYYLSHHLSKAFESFFGNVTCLPGCFSMYRIKSPKNGAWVPILANPDILEKYSESKVDTLHQKNLLLLGEDRYLTTLLLKTFPKRHNVFVPSAICRTTAPDSFYVLLSQRRRWVNSTIHNLLELLLIRDLCGIFCFSMQFMVAMELIGSVTLPAATGFTLYLIINSSLSDSPEVLPLTLLAAILGLPVLLMLLTVRRIKYVIWFFFYIIALPFWQIVIPLYAFWHFDDFTWGDTRKVQGKNSGGLDHSRSDGNFDYNNITFKRWTEWLSERLKGGDSECTMRNSRGQILESPRGLALSKMESSASESGATTLFSSSDRTAVDLPFNRALQGNNANDLLFAMFMKNYR